MDVQRGCWSINYTATTNQSDLKDIISPTPPQTPPPPKTQEPWLDKQKVEVRLEPVTLRSGDLFSLCLHLLSWKQANH